MKTQKISIELPGTPKFVPPLIGGDAEFKGHGPDVHVSARLRVRNGNELWATITMHAKETKKDYTEVSGSADYLMWKQEGGAILRIVSDSFSECRYRDTDHDDDVLVMGAGELVREFRCVGDTKGKEAGSRTGVTVTFNPVVIDVVSPE
ncbi:hypothetical protein HZ994_02280 [Akkermansiaceae bacterium]|nr:hypothetical protein HZ994_02280 [Akkermansiaceae bacterium]